MGTYASFIYNKRKEIQIRFKCSYTHKSQSEQYQLTTAHYKNARKICSIFFFNPLTDIQKLEENILLE